jgi:rhodanese-related sulfurtransferase
MTEHQVPEKKQTVLGLYVTAREAYEMWKADPQGVKILDVRTPEEYIFVGHPEMARNIPLLFIKYEWDAEKDQPVVGPNPDFAPAVMMAFETSDTLLVMCRSGGRSALGLAKAGFINAHNVIDGFEGDKVDDQASAYHGKRMKNGWKNSGSPWTYEVDPELLWLTKPQ